MTVAPFFALALVSSIALAAVPITSVHAPAKPAPPTTLQIVLKPLPVAPSPAVAVPPAMQYLYGSAEAAAASEQAYNALVDAVMARLRREQVKTPAPADWASAVLAPGSTFDNPTMLPCGTKPRAVVFDVDETILLNLGFESDDAAHPGRAYDETRWQRWESTGVDAVAPVPGALDAVKLLRAIGVTVIFNSNRSAANAASTEAALDQAGFGPVKHGDTLWLKGDVDSGSGKDSRRAAIAQKYCVVAMGGDQLGDFTDAFTGSPPERRAIALKPAVAALFGRVWFVLPNPVYGTAIKGNFDEVFPADKRWADPGAK
ncbi:MAG: HAD family acid phosphatase [Pseudomonadota bacterium]